MLMLLFYVVNIVCLALRTGYDDFNSRKVLVLKGFDVAFSIGYLIEIMTSGYAEFGNSRASSNVVRLVDLTLVLTNLLLLIFFLQGINQTQTDISLLPIRCSLRILRPFFFTTRFVDLRLFVVSVSKCLLRLNEVMLLLLLFLLWFGIAGLFQFGGLLQARCVSDWYSLATQSPAKQNIFFGLASNYSGNSTKNNSSLHVINLKLPFSSYLSPLLIFNDIITDPNVSELMVVRAISSFATAFVTLNQQKLTDYICGSALLSGSPTVLDSVAAMLEPASSTSSAASQAVSWDHMNVINGSQLLRILIQTFQLDQTAACSMQQTCDETPGTVLHGFVCPYSYTCLPDVYNPYNGSVSFDNIGMSLLTLQTAITGQLWYELMFWQRDCTDVFAYFFMPPLIFVGGYIIINLILVTLTTSYDEMRRCERLKLHHEIAIMRKDCSTRGAQHEQRDAHTRESPAREMDKTVAMQDQSSQLEDPLLLFSPDKELKLVRSFASETKEAAAVKGVGTDQAVSRELYLRHYSSEPRTWKRTLLTAQYYCKWYAVEQQWFTILFVTVILANSALICAEHYEMDRMLLNRFNNANIGFTVFFILELITRMLAAGSVGHFVTGDPFNLLGIAYVVISVIDISSGSTIPFIRALRIFRVLRLIHMSRDMYQWISLIIEACKASLVLVLFLFLMMIVFSTFGIQVYGGQFCGVDTSGAMPGDTTFINITDPVQPLVTIPSAYQPSSTCKGLPRVNFDTFSSAMLSSFIIATSDNWNTPMYQAMGVLNKFVAIPFVIYYFMTVYIITSLLVTILLSANEKHETLEEILDMERTQKMRQLVVMRQIEQQMRRQQTELEMRRLEAEAREGEESEFDNAEGDEEDEMQAVGSLGEKTKRFVITRSGRVRSKPLTTMLMEKLLLLWEKSRKPVRIIVESSPWHVVMSLIVIMSSICMGLEDPIAAPDASLMQTLHTIDVAATSFFALELVMLVHAYGLLSSPTAYLRRDWWNLIDACLVIGSIVGVSVSVKRGTYAAVAITVVRALRGLRIIRRLTSLRIASNTVIGALPEMKNVFLLLFGLFAVWGVFGVALFQGKLRQCVINGNRAWELDEPTCRAMGGDYVNLDLNFDNMPAALLMVVVCALLEDWSPEMFRTTDVVSAGEPFRRNATPLASVYFSIAAVFGGLLLMNLFAAVLVASYNRQKRQAAFQHSSLVSQEQEAWLLTVKRLARHLPPLRNQRRVLEAHGVVITESGLVSVMSQVTAISTVEDSQHITASPSTRIRRARIVARNIVHSKTFETCILLLVLANFASQIVQHYPENSAWTTNVVSINTAFSVFWFMECVLKIFGETLPVYMLNGWNRLDLLVAVVSVLGIPLSYLYSGRSSQLIVNMRVIRLARFTKSFFKLDRMIAQITDAVLSIGNVLLLILVVFLIYALIGMQLFGRIAQQPWGSGASGGASNAIDTHTNFGSLGSSFLLMARVTTGGDYPYIMMACSGAFTSEALGNCDQQLGTCGVAAPAAEIFFLSFVFIANIILTNLFVAVLLDAFESSGFNRAISAKDAKDFYRSWKSLDPSETLTLCPFDILPLIRSLHPQCVLGFMHWPKRKRIGMELQFLSSLQLVDVTHRVTISAIVDGLCRAAFPVTAPPNSGFGYRLFEGLLKQPQQHLVRMRQQVQMAFSDARQRSQSIISRSLQLDSQLGSRDYLQPLQLLLPPAHGNVPDFTDFFVSEALDTIRFNPELLPIKYQRELRLRFEMIGGDIDEEHVAAAMAKLPPGDELEKMYLAALTHKIIDEQQHIETEPIEGRNQHAIIDTLSPKSAHHLFRICASLIAIDSAVKTRRDVIRVRLTIAKAERDVIQRLRDKGIILPHDIVDQLFGASTIDAPKLQQRGGDKKKVVSLREMIGDEAQGFPHATSSGLVSRLDRSLTSGTQVIEIPPTQKRCLLRFASPPTEITPMVPFDLNLFLVDAFGFPCASPTGLSVATVCVAAETMGATTVPTLCTFVCPFSSGPPKLRLVPFVATSNILSETTLEGMNIGRSGRGGAWNAYTNSDPCLSATSQHRGVVFRVVSRCRAIVGIHNGVSDPSSESSWRQLPHSMHYSADLADPMTAPAFRIYENGQLVEECGTQEFEVGSEFSIRVRQNGRVAYFCGDRVIHTSKQEAVPNTIYSVMTRIANQESTASLGSMRLFAAGSPLAIPLRRLSWKPPIWQESEKKLTACIRAWILGTDFVPATLRASLTNNPVPRWAFAALSLSSMFALGAAGCQGAHVPSLMTHHHEISWPLEQVEDQRDELLSLRRRPQWPDAAIDL